MTYQLNSSTDTKEQKETALNCQTYRGIKQKTCKSCQTQFTPKSGRQDYCTLECKAMFKPKVNTRLVQCKQCDVQFIPTSSTSKFCSIRCRNESYAEKEVKHCAHCDSEIKTKPAKKFCSKKCRNEFRLRKTNNGVEGVNYIVCPVCDSHVKQISAKHAKMHGYKSVKDMQEKLHLTTTVCESKKEKGRGENNSAYQHGGRFSKFSKNYIHGYDEEWNKQHIENIRQNRKDNPEKYPNTIEYWLNKTNRDIDEATKLYKKHQTRDLAFFVNRYGEEEGVKRYRAKTEKWVNTMNAKPDSEKLEINKKKARAPRVSYSKFEKELYYSIKSVLPATVSQLILHKEGESRCYVYDIALGNSIVEFNGDFWHANPRIYPESHVCPYTNKTQKEIMDYDKEKVLVAESNGFNVLTVWEHDYNQNKEKVVQECINFLIK